MNGGFAPEMQVKQYVAEVEGRWSSFRVFRTGSDKHYLFCQIDRDGCDTGLHVPVLKSELQPAIRRALAKGVGYRRPRP